MKYLNKTYYVGLYSAAMFHGAAHQQPQEFYIISEKPKPRKISNDIFLINFTEKRNRESKWKTYPQNGYHLIY